MANMTSLFPTDAIYFSSPVSSPALNRDGGSGQRPLLVRVQMAKVFRFPFSLMLSEVHHM